MKLNEQIAIKEEKFLIVPDSASTKAGVCQLRYDVYLNGEKVSEHITKAQAYSAARLLESLL